jgi:uncharacterized low-complexity protein
MRKINLRLWIKILLLVCALACGTAILLAAHSNSARPAPTTVQQTESAHASATPTQTFNGIVTDTRCGAKHSAKVGLSAADCTRACVHAGEHFALVDGEKAYTLTGDSAALKRLAGARVKVAGTLTGNIIAVVSVAEPDPRAE